jgi:hypothetical protein
MLATRVGRGAPSRVLWHQPIGAPFGPGVRSMTSASPERSSFRVRLITVLWFGTDEKREAFERRWLHERE